MTATEYIAALGGRPKLILIEDHDEWWETYCASLRQAGFGILPGKVASQLPGLLVVIAIIAILAAPLLPALAPAWRQ